MKRRPALALVAVMAVSLGVAACSTTNGSSGGQPTLLLGCTRPAFLTKLYQKLMAKSETIKIGVIGAHRAGGEA